MNKSTHIKSISELHTFLELARPAHPLISVIPLDALKNKAESNSSYTFDLYQISFKKGLSCDMQYGRSTYDFDDGSLIFLAPGQTATVTNVESSEDASGWTLVFHPDLLKHTALSNKMEQYTFFEYDSNESLHLSEKEIAIVTDFADKILYETSLNMDRHTQALLCSHLELMLGYCTRFYDRQFYVRSDLNKKYVTRFEALLNGYYQSEKPLELGVPTVHYCGKELGLSPYYLSDLLKRETGKTALEIIHLFLVEKAKKMMAEESLSITQISCDLGFEYPQHFSKLFKAKAGMSPREFKSSSQTKH
jgi:AraC-like DNA-binding protein